MMCVFLFCIIISTDVLRKGSGQNTHLLRPSTWLKMSGDISRASTRHQDTIRTANIDRFTTYPWFEYFYQSGVGNVESHSEMKTWPYKEFKRSVNDTHTETLRQLLLTFHNTLTKRNIFYFMCGGTLLGSYRFHGVIPWDDDVDVYVKQRDAHAVHLALKSLSPEYVLANSTDTNQDRWKFYKSNCSDLIHKKTPWRFPFLDISFLHQNKTHFWDTDVTGYSEFVYHKSLIKPRVLRPFNGIWLMAPRQTKIVLEITYSLEECSTNSWDHKHELVIPYSTIVDCTDLSIIYPFVDHDSEEESLIFQGRAIYTFK